MVRLRIVVLLSLLLCIAAPAHAQPFENWEIDTDLRVPEYLPLDGDFLPLGCFTSITIVWPESDPVFVHIYVSLSDYNDLYVTEYFWGWDYAVGYTAYDLSWDEVDYLENFCDVMGPTQKSSPFSIGRFQSVYNLTGHDDETNKFVYTKDPNCTHECQGPRFCWSEGGSFLSWKGFAVVLFGLGQCINIPGYPKVSTAKPDCISPGTGTLMGFDDNCSSPRPQAAGSPSLTPCAATTSKKQ